MSENPRSGGTCTALSTVVPLTLDFDLEALPTPMRQKVKVESQCFSYISLTPWVLSPRSKITEDKVVIEFESKRKGEEDEGKSKIHGVYALMASEVSPV